VIFQIQDNGIDLEGGDGFVEIDDMLLDELDLEELDLSGLRATAMVELATTATASLRRLLRQSL